jgi:hypothetical protein
MQFHDPLVDGVVERDSPEDALPFLLAAPTQFGSKVTERLALLGEVHVEEHVAGLYLAAMDGEAGLECLGLAQRLRRLRLPEAGQDL